MPERGMVKTAVPLDAVRDTFDPADLELIETVAESLGADDALFASGFEPALIGFVQVFNRRVPLYDRTACIAILVQQGATPDEAEEYFDFNVTGAYVGENTPAFATVLRSARVSAAAIAVLADDDAPFDPMLN